MTFSYDGSDFKGYQKQPKDRTVQGELESVLKKINGQREVNIVASGRTDAGVHALGQVANFKTNSNIPIEKFPIALNTKLKRSIRILEAEEVEEKFHSRYNCKKKTYRYIINNSQNGTAIYRNLEYNFSQKLDVKKMQEAAGYFIGEHDFKGFKASGTSSKSSVRTIYKAEVYQEKEKIIIELTGNGFLYNMVRIISGTLIEVGIGKIQPNEIKAIIESGNRERAGKTLPPQGLYLVKVEYE